MSALAARLDFPAPTLSFEPVQSVLAVSLAERRPHFLSPVSNGPAPFSNLALGTGLTGQNEPGIMATRNFPAELWAGWIIGVAIFATFLFRYFRASARRGRLQKPNFPPPEYSPPHGTASINQARTNPPSTQQSPAQIVRSDETDSAGLEVVPDDASEFHPTNALVVDDRKYNRAALAALLETLGSSVQAVSTGSEAIALAATTSFDLILLGYSAPGLNAPDIARRIRLQSSASSRARFLATTTDLTAEKRMHCLMSGMDDLLALPTTREQLRQILQGLGQRPSSPSPSSGSTPADPLANLRLLALRKRVSFLEETNLYLTEFESELRQLEGLLARTDSAGSARQAHLLCGRCAFIRETTLELIFREVGASAAASLWGEAIERCKAGAAEFPGLRTKLVKFAQGDPRESDH